MLGKIEERLGQRIRERRKSLGISLQDLAAESGVSYGALQNVEAGKSSPRVDTLEAICAVLKMTPATFWDPVRAASALSQSAATGVLTTADFVVVLERVESMQRSEPDRLRAALAILFDDDSLAPADLDLETLLHASAKPG